MEFSSQPDRPERSPAHLCLCSSGGLRLKNGEACAGTLSADCPKSRRPLGTWLHCGGCMVAAGICMGHLDFRHLRNAEFPTGRRSESLPIIAARRLTAGASQLPLFDQESPSSLMAKVTRLPKLPHTNIMLMRFWHPLSAKSTNAAAHQPTIKPSSD